MNVVTVFGASGFIGRYVVGEIAKTGARVRAAVRLPERAKFLKPMGDVGQITPVAANIRDDASVAAAVEGADTVINLAGILFPGGKQTFDSVHADGARAVAAAAKAAGATQLIHMSAIGADPARICELMRSTSPPDSLMIVGHNPDLEELAGYLISEPSHARVSLGKGACAVVDLEEPPGAGRGTLTALWQSKQLVKWAR